MRFLEQLKNASWFENDSAEVLGVSLHAPGLSGAVSVLST
jgi:hypothetical protein